MPYLHIFTFDLQRLTLSLRSFTKVGLLIGPRGNTLKKMETESLAKIAIRGKGSVKEGKGRSDAAHTSNQEEDLHCLIMADTEEKVNKAKKLIHNVIETVSLKIQICSSLLANRYKAASIPEGQNELKRNQLRELAALNGTLRDDENQACQNCESFSSPLCFLGHITNSMQGGQIGHRKYDCPEQRNFTANIICRVCGNAGHMARDCPDRQRGADWRNGAPGGAAPGRPAAGRIGGGDAVDREYEVRPPLRKQPLQGTNIICSNSCKNYRVAHPTVMHLNASKPALADMRMDAATKVTGISNHGSVDLRAQLLHGNSVEMIIAMEELHHHGLLVVEMKIMEAINKAAMAVLPAEDQHPGSDSKTALRHRLQAASMVATVDTPGVTETEPVAMVGSREWALLRAWEVVPAVSGLHLVWVLFSRTMVPMEALHLLHLRMIFLHR